MGVELVQLGFGLLVVALLFVVWVFRGASVMSIGYWPLSWVVMICEGIVRIAIEPSPTYHLTSSLTAVFLLAGAIRYAEMPLPRGIVPAGLAVGVFNTILAQTGAPALANAVGFVFEPGLMILGGYIVMRHATPPARTLVHGLVPYTLFAIAALDVYDFFALTEGVDAILPWLVLGVPAATIQTVANFERIRAHTDRVEEELDRSVSLLQATLESTGDGILVVDREGHYRTFNGIFARMWRIPESVLERRDSKLTLSHAMPQLTNPDAFYEKVQSLYATPEAESFDTLEFKDGRVYERYSRPQRIGDEIVGRVWSFRDVTERKRAEHTAERYRTHLEDLVQERTRELVESRDQLRNADRLAAVGTLAAGVAHQINNPIGSILNSAEYALLCENDDDVKETWKRALEVNAQEARRCAAIVRSMLQFSRAEPVAREVEDLAVVIQRAVRAVAPYASERSAKILPDFSDQAFWVEMSPIELEQVMVNLLRNAVESRESGAMVSVRARRTVDSDGGVERPRVQVDVVDDGRGIPPDRIGRVFDPFFSTRVHQGGTGLGLSVAHGIVTGHGGEISAAKNTAGAGTRISFTLPLREAPGGDAQGTSPSG